MQLIKEKKIMEGFMKEVLSPTGKLATYGMKQVEMALNMGAVHMLLISEGLEKMNRALKLLENLVSNNNMTKSISWSILVCLNATSSRAWKYSKEEKALGSSLSEKVGDLIKSKPEDYTEILEAISERIGLGNKLEVI